MSDAEAASASEPTLDTACERLPLLVIACFVSSVALNQHYAVTSLTENRGFQVSRMT
jgi:hypothetical protein